MVDPITGVKREPKVRHIDTLHVRGEVSVAASGTGGVAGEVGGSHIGMRVIGGEAFMVVRRLAAVFNETVTCKVRVNFIISSFRKK